VAAAGGQWLALIDDDERPSPNWLVAFLRCAHEVEADAVFGPVLPIFPHDVPRWIVDGGFFERRRLANGAPIAERDARTSNVMLKSSLTDLVEGPFDPDFGLTGGEDSVFFRAVMAQGKRLHWCNEAVVEEQHTAERLTWRWLVKRSFRTGQTHTRCFLDPPGGPRPAPPAILYFFARSIVLALGAAALAVLNAPFGKRYSVPWLRVLATQAGKMFPSSLFAYKPYLVSGTRRRRDRPT
jgi:hypothetical protein